VSASAFLAAWTWDPTVGLGLVLASALYGIGSYRYARRTTARRRPQRWRALCYGAGLGFVALALLSPIATFDGQLFALHMIQHMLLVLAAAPLIWLGAPGVPLLWALPAQERRGIGRLLRRGGLVHRLFATLTHPFVAATLYLGMLAVWHVPALYDAAQGPTVVHVLEHVLFFGSGLLFWWPIVHPTGGRRRLGYGGAIFYVAPALLEGTIIGALLTFASEPLYATYRAATRISSLSALEDQQLAGLIMWIPSASAYMVAIFVLLGLFLRDEERQSDLKAAAVGR
jgi:putative membrane protein